MVRTGAGTTKTQQEWIGKSTEIKPKLTIEQAGSTFLETDTSEIWIFDGEEWNKL